MSDAKFIAITMIAVLAGIGGLMAYAHWSSGQTCTRRAALMGMQHKHELQIGCMVRTQSGQWMPIDNFRP